MSETEMKGYITEGRGMRNRNKRVYNRGHGNEMLCRILNCNFSISVYKYSGSVESYTSVVRHVREQKNLETYLIPLYQLHQTTRVRIPVRLGFSSSVTGSTHIARKANINSYLNG